MKKKKVVGNLILGNFVNEYNKPTKYCTFCGHGDKSSSEHVHLFLSGKASDGGWSYR